MTADMQPENLLPQIDELKEIWKEIGWPPYPPKESPPSYDWWKEEIEVPSRARSWFPNGTFAAFDGLPHSGKSWLIESFGEDGNIAGYPYDVSASDHLYHSAGPDFSILNLDLLNDPPIIDDDDGLLTQYLFERDDWFYPYYFQLVKNMYWEKKFYQFATNPPEVPTVHIGERGPVDQVIFSHALLTTNDKRYALAPEPELEFIKEDLLETLFGIFLKANYHATIILIGADRELLQERRRMMGVEDEGIVDSPFFYDLSGWYGYFIKNVFPTIHNAFGTGLLVLDGSRPIEENRNKVLAHLEPAVGRTLQRHR